MTMPQDGTADDDQDGEPGDYIPLIDPDISEAEVAVLGRILTSGSLSDGRMTEAFEDAFAAWLGRAHAVAVSSGTIATLLALKALPVLILGGFTSVPGAIIGGLIIGAGEKLAEVFLGPSMGGGIEIWFAYVLALLFLLVRPQGLFGEAARRRA